MIKFNIIPNDQTINWLIESIVINSYVIKEVILN
jgi:hypothetical protein